MEISSSPAKSSKMNAVFDPVNDDFVVELDKYWPYGLKDVQDPENPDLVFVHCQEFVGKLYCRFCDGSDADRLSRPVELVPKMRYCSAKATKEVHLSEHEESYKEFVESHDVKAQRFISVNQLLRPKCCEKDCLAVATVLERDLKFTKLFRYFYQNHRIVVYLKLDPASEAMIPLELDEKFAQTLRASYLKAFWSFSKNFSLSDTLDIAEVTMPEGFGMQLREYQLRSINWMQSIEAVETLEHNTIVNNVSAWSKEPLHLKIKLGHTGFYVGFRPDEPMISASPKTQNPPPQRIRGGILADDTGSGKTITTLGLVYSNPFTPEKEADRVNRFPDISAFNQSRASLVICPENIQLQWIDEAKRCNPEFKITSFVKLADAKKINLTEIVESDLIVTSYQFLVELSRKKSAEKEGIVNLETVHFYRIILDEFHELTPTRSDVNTVLKRLRADHIWGLTGTPTFTSLPATLRYFNISAQLETILTGNVFAHNEFIRKFVKRNEPDLNLPPIETEIVWIQLRSTESVLHNWKSERASHRTKLMMCSHYQLADKPENGAFMTLEQVKTLMTSSKQKKVEEYQKEINEKLILFHATPQKLKEHELLGLKLQIESLQKHLDEAQRKLNYCQSVFKVIENPEGNECRICYDIINENNLSLLPCSHIFCYDCIMSAINFRSTYECPLCRQHLSRRKEDIFKIVPETKSVELSAALARIDTSKYSSKMISLCTYLIETIESDANAKIILFLQYKDLANFISKTLSDELKLNHVRVTGSVDQRQSAIKGFTESDDVRLIMLSSEDSVSGINLTQATHVILLHPFYTDQGEEADLAYEKQGISRAYRFGLDHPLKVVRFAVRGTIEEEITMRRENIKL